MHQRFTAGLAEIESYPHLEGHEDKQTHQANVIIIACLLFLWLFFFAFLCPC